MAERKLRFAHALLPQGWADDVAIAVSPEGSIVAVTANEPDRREPTMAGFAVAGMANVHAHAHQRAMAEQTWSVCMSQYDKVLSQLVRERQNKIL